MNLSIVLPPGNLLLEGQEPVQVSVSNAVRWNLFLETEVALIHSVSVHSISSKINPLELTAWEDESESQTFLKELPVLQTVWKERNFSETWHFLETNQKIWLYQCQFDAYTPGFWHQFVTFQNEKAIVVQFLSSPVYDPEYKNCESASEMFKQVLEKIQIE